MHQARQRVEQHGDALRDEASNEQHDRSRESRARQRLRLIRHDPERMTVHFD
jgi:hypothetical protein